MKRYLQIGLQVLFFLSLPKLSLAAIKDFKLEAYFFQKVGESFPLYVKDAVDEFGNSASGTIQVRIKAGDGLSPDSFPPILNPIVVNNGAGFAYQVLTNVAPTIFEGVADTVVRSSNTIFVTSGPLHHFSLSINSPQTSGQPFTAPSFMTAKDMYGNPVVNFDAGADSVVISASDSGEMSNHVFRTTQDFILGLTDLSQKQTTYTGRGGFLTFQAQSSSGKSGISNTILVRSLRIESLNISPGSVNRGDTLTVKVRVFNTADISGTVTDIDLDFSLGDLSFEILNASLPHTISANSSFDYQLRVMIPQDYSAGTCQVSCQVAGLFGSFVIVDSLSEAGSFQISGGVSFEYVKGNLQPTIAVVDFFRPGYSLRLKYRASSNAWLDTNSFISFIDDDENHIKAYLIRETILPTSDTISYLSFYPKRLSSMSLSPGRYQLSLVLEGFESVNIPFRDSLVLSDSLELRQLVKLEYVSGSLTPDTVSVEDTVVFSFELRNPLDSVVTIRETYPSVQFESEINFTYFRVASLALENNLMQVQPGINQVSTKPIAFPKSFPWGNYNFSVVLNYVLTPSKSGYNLILDTKGEQINLRPPEDLQRLAVEAQSENVQFISPGISTKLFKLIVTNQPQNTNHSIILNGFTLGFGDIPAHDLLSSYSVEVTTRDWNIDFPSVTGDKAVIEFPEPLILSPYQEDTIVFYATFNPEANANNFVLTLDASDFQPRDYFGGQTGVPVPVTSSSGEVLNYQSPVFTLLSGSFKQSASVFPNPFNSDNQQATIIYNASPPAQVSLDIFTLTGEKVLSLKNPEGTSQFLWDGKNEAGKRVLSGVYLGLLKNHQSGEEVRLRIGVVR